MEGSFECKEDQCTTVKVCKDCGVRKGDKHRWYYRYYPQLDLDIWSLEEDADKRTRVII